MSAQAKSANSPIEAAENLKSISEPVAAAPESSERSKKSRDAAGRVRELLSEVRRLRANIDALKGELLVVTQQKDKLETAERNRQLAAEEKEKQDQKKAEDHRLLCFRALVDCAHQTGCYKRHPDFDSRVKRSQQFLSTQLLEAILLFPKNQAPELLYTIACNPEAAAKLSAHAPLPQLFWLMNMGGEFSEQLKWASFLESGKNAS